MKTIKKTYSLVALLLAVTLCFTACSQKKQPQPNNSENAVSEYLEVECSNELNLFASEKTSTPLTYNQAQLQSLLQSLSLDTFDFSYSAYYGLDESLQLYKSTKVEKSTSSNLLDSKGMIDSSKLLASVRTNNKKHMEKGKNISNAFYTETSEADQKKICDLIAKIVNETCNETERKQMANTLSALTMFNHTGSASNAYITNSLTFVYNPSMSNMYADTQNIVTGESKENMQNSVLAHEVMHLIQHRGDDLIEENGHEVGFCREYKAGDNENVIPVDSLWIPWILEASAELKMADYLKMDTHTYAKKISYTNSYNLSRFLSVDSKDDFIENIVFCSTLEEAYTALNLGTAQEQRKFHEFLYSVEILQSDPKDFWENYSNLTGETPSDSEKLAIRMQIRAEVVKYLSYQFYQNLINAVRQNKVKDLETLFYLIRVWEIDCYGHLEYRKIASLDSAKDFINWHNQVQTSLFSTLSGADIATSYDAYCLQVKTGDSVSDNCSLELFHPFTGTYLSEIKSNYATSGFVRNKTMMTYLSQQ